MIYSVKGKVIHTEQNLVVVECAGVGYGCQTTLNTLRNVQVSDEITLYTYMSVRERKTLRCILRLRKKEKSLLIMFFCMDLPDLEKPHFPR